MKEELLSASDLWRAWIKVPDNKCSLDGASLSNKRGDSAGFHDHIEQSRQWAE